MRTSGLTTQLRSLGRLAAFPLSVLCIAAATVAAAAPQNPPRIPGLPGFGKPAAQSAPAYGDSRDQVDTAVVVSQPKAVAGADVPIAVTFKLAPGYHI